jgi:hypothetical protein
MEASNESDQELWPFVDNPPGGKLLPEGILDLGWELVPGVEVGTSELPAFTIDWDLWAKSDMQGVVEVLKVHALQFAGAAD